MNYQKASKESKGKILDELCNVCKYNRKYAIWKIGQLPMEDKPRADTKRKRLSISPSTIDRALKAKK